MFCRDVRVERTRGVMRYCTQCLMPDTLPNIGFTSDGVCSICANHNRDVLDSYERRLEELKGIVKRILKGRGRRRWDCLVGVSGGKDSTRQALWVREKLEMSPLLVSVAYPPRQFTENGAHNLSNLTRAGFDVLMVGPAPPLSRDLVRAAFLKFCNWCKATEMALFAGVPRIAVEKKIPLIFWGENPAINAGDLAVLGESMWDGKNLVQGNTLQGGDLSWFREVAGGDGRLYMYQFPSREELKKSNVHTIFMGPIFKDWSGEVNSMYSLSNGLHFRGEDPRKTGDLIGTRMLDEDWTIVNFLLKYYKFGFSRGTQHVNMMIRRGRISREEAIPIAEEFDQACDDAYIDSFCEYIGISNQTFWDTAKKFAHPDLFDTSGERPVKKFKVGVGLL